MIGPELNAAQHYRSAERAALAARRAATADQQERLVALGRLHLDLACAADRVLLAHDGRRDPDWLDPGQGWPPLLGDIWSDVDGHAWITERQWMVRIHDQHEASVEAAHNDHGAMRLVFRPNSPAMDDPWEVPF